MYIALAFCIYVKYQLYILLPILKRNASDSVSPFLTWFFPSCSGPPFPTVLYALQNLLRTPKCETIFQSALIFYQRLANQRKVTLNGSDMLSVCLCYLKQRGVLDKIAKTTSSSLKQRRGWDVLTKFKAWWPVATGPADRHSFREMSDGHGPLESAPATETEPLRPCWLELHIRASACSQPKGASAIHGVFIDTLHSVLKCRSLWPMAYVVAADWHFLPNVLHWI